VCYLAWLIAKTSDLSNVDLLWSVFDIDKKRGDLIIILSIRIKVSCLLSRTR